MTAEPENGRTERPAFEEPQVRSATERFKDMLAASLERLCVLEEQLERAQWESRELRAYVARLEALVPEDVLGGDMLE